MKKFTIALFYAFIFLSTNFTDIKTDVYSKNIGLNEERLVDIKNETYDLESIVENELIEEQKSLESQNVETKTEASNVVNTSLSEDYVNSNVQITETYGTYGRLYISGFNVALYDYNVNTSSNLSLQEIVDNADSAAYYASHNRLVIADHDNQGFNILIGLSEGSTSYIKFEDGSTISYRLVRKAKGYNTGQDLVDTEGNSFFNMESDLIMYTCYDDGIMVTLWNLI